MSLTSPRRIKSVEELTAEENERLRLLREWDQALPPYEIERKRLFKALLVSFLFALALDGVVSLANHLSLQSSILLFLAVFAIFAILFLMALTLGTGERLYYKRKKKGG